VNTYHPPTHPVVVRGRKELVSLRWGSLSRSPLSVAPYLWTSCCRWIEMGSCDWNRGLQSGESLGSSIVD